MNENFSAISDEFNTSFSEEKNNEIDAIESEIDLFESKKNEIITKSTTSSNTLEDKEYIQDDIKQLITNGKKVLSLLQKDLKIGSAPRMYEVYSTLMSTVLVGLRELRDLNKTVADMQMFSMEPDVSSTEVNIKMSGKELLNMIKNASDDNQMNAISADFKVEEETRD